MFYLLHLVFKFFHISWLFLFCLDSSPQFILVSYFCFVFFCFDFLSVKLIYSLYMRNLSSLVQEIECLWPHSHFPQVDMMASELLRGWYPQVAFWWLGDNLMNELRALKKKRNAKEYSKHLGFFPSVCFSGKKATRSCKSRTILWN